MDWHESEGSDDEIQQDSQPASRKRSSRACDQCRKTKSKCERGSRDSLPCKSCQLTGTACTFLGPSFKRGPPKGYIHAIEQRWHQVESLLGAIMQCPEPRVQSIVSDLRQDNLAREILTRVDTGPYGPSGRRSQPIGATKEDFFASVLKSNESSTVTPRDPSRSRRQSRVSREKVSSNLDGGLSILPTQEWQDNLARRLSRCSSTSSYSGPSSNSATLDTLGEPLVQRRRLMNGQMPDWTSLYTMDSEPEDVDSMKDPTEALGELSLDENREVRFHGKASGLHILGHNDRTDNRHEGGVWSLPMARVWPPSKDYQMLHIPQEEDFDIQLPPVHVQEHLIELYFTYIHPAFPVIHKSRFLRDYQAKKQGVQTPPRTSGSPQPEPSQKISSLLLLSMFAIAARFRDDEMPFPPPGKMWEAGREYAIRAEAVLSKISHHSRPSTVQALLLLGYRNFGIGITEQAWLHIGNAIRMAIDLGMNCNSDTWKMHGHPLFTVEETQIRRQIWWACVLTDRYGSIYMGRPIIIRESDYDVPFPEIYEEEEQQQWQPLQSDTINVIYRPVPLRTMSCFCALSSLAIIVGTILCKIYPVRSIAGSSRRNALAALEAQLDRWYLALPTHLQYDSASKRNLPPPHIVFLHIRYWGSVLLLHRAFIPNWKETDTGLRNSTTDLKSFDLAQSAASHISAIANAFRENFTLKRCSPFVTCYILSAGIMHILTLSLRPSNVQAKLGLQQCMAALKDMSVVWPSASRAWDLLNGVNLGFDNSQIFDSSLTDRYKRDAEDAFGQEKSYFARDTFGTPKGGDKVADAGESGVQALSSRIMAHMLGLDVPGVEPSTSFLPGYEWWPRPNGNENQSVGAGNDGALPAPTNSGYDRQESWLGTDSPLQTPGFGYNYYGL